MLRGAFYATEKAVPFVEVSLLIVC